VVCLAGAVAVARRQAALTFGALGAAAVVLFVSTREPPGVRVTFLPVGQGDGAVVEIPTASGRDVVLVIDAGGNVSFNGKEPKDPGADVVVPFLRRRGIKRVDVMVASHAHPDHVKGLAAVARAFPVGELWHNGSSLEGGLMRALLAALPKTTLVKSTPEILGEHALGTAVVEVLAPAPVEKTPNYPELSQNDNSLVLRLRTGNDAIVFPGDIEHLGEELLLASGAPLSASVVKAPHHGSGTSSTDAFVERVGAAHVVLCTGRDNVFNFPNPTVVERYRTAGAAVWDTARHGEVTFWLSGAGVVVEPFVAEPR
jgi:competence protein ComEC